MQGVIKLFFSNNKMKNCIRWKNSEQYRFTNLTQIFSVLLPVPAQPLQISIVDLDSDSIEIIWQPGSGVYSNYLIEYFPVGPTTPGAIIKSKADERVQEFVDLSPGTAYTIRVVQQGVNAAATTLTHYTRK